MLRIDIQREPEATSFVVEGKLVGAWVNELEKCWETCAKSEPARPILVNLCAVAFIDADGRKLLTKMRQRGVKILPSGCLMKAIVDEIEAEVGAGAAVADDRLEPFAR